VIEPGHRLRLALTHGDVPHMLAATPDALNSVGAVDSVHIDPAQPSFLTLPVAGPAPALAPIIGSAFSLACSAARARILLPRIRRDRVVAATVFAGRGRRTVRGRSLHSVVVTPAAAVERVRIVVRTARGRRFTVRRTVRGRRCA